MKAVHVNSYGGPEVLDIKDGLDSPSPEENQIQVEMHAASVNPFDVKVVSGMFKDHMPLKFPTIPGGDYAGVVSSLGEGVTDFKVGDKVYGSANVVNGGLGSYAEVSVANVKNSAHMPSTISFEDAAALSLVGSSAVQALEQHIKLKKGQIILIHGGAGGIGHLAIQLAKSIGAYVATTVSTDDVDYAKSLGADEVIDYKKQNFEEELSNFDAVYDLVGGETTEKSFKVLKRGGVLVSMLGAPNEELARKHGVTAVGQGTKTETENLTRVAELVDAGKIKVNVDKVFQLDAVKDAFAYQEENSPRGKVVLKIK